MINEIQIEQRYVGVYEFHWYVFFSYKLVEKKIKIQLIKYLCIIFYIIF